MGEFEGRIVVVTGAGSGIGRATALAFARQGATIVAASRRVAEGESLVAEIAALGGNARFVATDVAQPGDIERLMTTAVTAFGGIDVLFNNAGYQEPRTTIVDTPEESVD